MEEIQEKIQAPTSFLFHSISLLSGSIVAITIFSLSWFGLRFLIANVNWQLLLIGIFVIALTIVAWFGLPNQRDEEYNMKESIQQGFVWGSIGLLPFIILTFVFYLYYESYQHEVAREWLAKPINDDIFMTYVEALVSFIAIAVTLPAIFLDRDPRIVSIRTKFSQAAPRKLFSKQLQPFEKYIDPKLVYAYATAAILITAGYLIPTPQWICDPQNFAASSLCYAISFLRYAAPIITTFMLLSTIILTGTFIWILIEYQKKRLLRRIEKACIAQARQKRRGEIENSIVEFFSEVGRACHQGADKKSVLDSIERIVKDDQIPLSHKTLSLLAKETVGITENGDKNNCRDALEVIQTIIQRAITNEGSTETQRDLTVVTIWGEFAEIIFDTIELDVDLNLDQFIDEFNITEEKGGTRQLTDPRFAAESGRLLAQIGMKAVGRDKINAAHTALDKIHSDLLLVIESDLLSDVEETSEDQIDDDKEETEEEAKARNAGVVFSQFLGLCAHLWTHDTASKQAIRKKIFHLEDAAGGKENLRLTKYAKNAKRFFEADDIATANKIEQMLYEMNHIEYLQAYLRDTMGADAFKDHRDEIVYHYPSIDALALASARDLKACGVTEPGLAEKLLAGVQKEEKNRPSPTRYGDALTGMLYVQKQNRTA